MEYQTTTNWSNYHVPDNFAFLMGYQFIIKYGKCFHDLEYTNCNHLQEEGILNYIMQMTE